MHTTKFKNAVKRSPDFEKDETNQNSYPAWQKYVLYGLPGAP